MDEATISAAAITGLIADPDPSIRFNPGPGDWSNVFQVNFSVATFADQYLVQSELRKRIYKRLLKEKISMPYPTKNVIVESKATGPGS